MKYLKLIPLFVFSLLAPLILPLTQANAANFAISSSDYPFVAALARASILADQPASTTF